MLYLRLAASCLLEDCEQSWRLPGLWNTLLGVALSVRINSFTASRADEEPSHFQEVLCIQGSVQEVQLEVSLLLFADHNIYL